MFAPPVGRERIDTPSGPLGFASPARSDPIVVRSKGDDDRWNIGSRQTGLPTAHEFATDRRPAPGQAADLSAVGVVDPDPISTGGAVSAPGMVQPSPPHIRTAVA